MLNWIVRASIRHRAVIIALALMTLAYGFFIAQRSKLDVFPEFAPPRVLVQTQAHGLSAEQVELLVTRPLEAVINGVAGIRVLRSKTIQGVSVITAIFNEDTDIYRDRQLVAERVAEATSELPKGVSAPTLGPLTSSTGLVLMMGLTSERVGPKELRDIADWELKPELLGTAGVASVIVFGGEKREFHVQFNPKKLRAYGVSIPELATALDSASGVQGAGFIETTNQRITLRTHGQTLTPAALASVVVRRTQGLTVHVSDLATVALGYSPKYGDANIQGKPGVLIEVFSQYGANTLQVTEAVRSRLATVIPALARRSVQVEPDLFRPADFIQRALGNVRSSLYLGAAIVAAILFLFLLNLRVSLISIFAIPLSLLISVIALHAFGMSLNTLTLGGLAIAVGEVVDDAIIDVENIYRRLREKARQKISEDLDEKTPNRLWIILDASMEVRHSVIFATFTVVLVFFPVVTLRGLQGRLFAPLGYAYIFSILASLIVALTLTPALSAVLLQPGKISTNEPRIVEAIKGRYSALLSRIVARPGVILAVAAGLVLGAIILLPRFQASFLPEFKEGEYILHMQALPGTSLEESRRIGQRVSAALLKIEGVHTVSQQIGTAEYSEDTWGPNYTEFQIHLKNLGGEDTERVLEQIRKSVAKFPGLYFALNTYLTERIEETVTGATAPVVARIFGQDFADIDRVAAKVEGILRSTPGAESVTRASRDTVPELDIQLDFDKLKAFGIPPEDALLAIQAAYRGANVGQVYRGIRVINLRLLLDPAMRSNPETVGNLELRNPDGAWKRLGDLATLTMRSGRYTIYHQNGIRMESVTCNVGGRGIDSFAREFKAKIAGLQLPEGVRVYLSGTAQARAAAKSDLWLKSIFAAIGILLLLWVAFESFNNLLLIFLNLPFALVGGVLAAFVTGGELSLGSLVGFVTLFGITTRNAIMLISHYHHLVTNEGETWGPSCALRGARERLLPILMTATVTALALLPLALGTGDPGREIEGPMAIVILGGLFTSTALNLLVMPPLALRFARFPPPNEF